MTNMDRKSFYIESLGCIANRIDSKRVENFFCANGYVSITNPSDADIIILMTCSFTQVSEDYNFRRIKELIEIKNESAELIIGGCLPAISKKRMKGVFNGIAFTPRTLDRLNKFIKARVKIANISPIGEDIDNNSVKVIRISTGCMNKCTYCAIPFANGKTMSRKIEDILFDIEACYKDGFSKIKFVSEDIGAYGQEKGITIVDLIKSVVNSNFNIELYLDNFNPNWFFKYQSELIELFKSPKIVKSFYIPIQSGSDRILTLMKRGYTVDEASKVIKTIYKHFPEAKISSDFIVGFPSEEDIDFDKTKQFLKEHHFHYLEIFTYEDRPNTVASKIEQKVSNDEIESRRQELSKIWLEQFIDKNNTNSFDELNEVLTNYEKFPVNFNLILDK